METIHTTNAYKDIKGVACIKLNRPEVLNALNNTCVREIVEQLETWDRDDSIRIIIITGDKRAFAAGADIKQMLDSSTIDQLLDQRAGLWKKFQQIAKPIIAAVDGLCLGAGHELAMSCDLVVASDKARFGQPEVNLGIIPGAGGTQRLPRIVGKSRAMLMTLTGDMIDAQTALDWGLLAKVVPSHSLLEEVLEIAKKINLKSPIATRLIKQSINKSFQMGLNDGLDFERRNFYITFSSQDQKEGMRAFVEKRPPQYQGH